MNKYMIGILLTGISIGSARGQTVVPKGSWELVAPSGQIMGDFLTADACKNGLQAVENDYLTNANKQAQIEGNAGDPGEALAIEQNALAFEGTLPNSSCVQQ